MDVWSVTAFILYTCTRFAELRNPNSSRYFATALISILFGAMITFQTIVTLIETIKQDLQQVTITINGMAKDASQIVETTKIIASSIQETTKESQSIIGSMKVQSESVQEVLRISAELNDMASYLTNQMNEFNMKK